MYLDENFKYHSDYLLSSSHFNQNDHGAKHSKDPCNCLAIFFYDTGHLLLVLFLLWDSNVVMEIKHNYLSKEEFGKKFGVATKTGIYLTFQKVVHNFIYKMMKKVKKHREEVLQKSSTQAVN